MKLASITHCHIFSYSLCPSAAFQGEMIKFLLFPFRYLTTIIRDGHPPSVGWLADINSAEVDASLEESSCLVICTLPRLK